MAVSVDTVYQRVLALANKEQRGYITPQEFNLFANQAQMALFESYFYQKNTRETADAEKSNEIDESNISELLDRKLAPFHSFEYVIDGHTFPSTVTVNSVAYPVFQTGMVLLGEEPCQKVSMFEAQRLRKSTRHMLSTANQAPFYTNNRITGRDILVYAGSTTEEAATEPDFTDATCDYNNDPTITHNVNSSIVAGLGVSGTGIPSGATVASLNSTTSFELSASTTGGAVVDGTLTFSRNMTVECFRIPVPAVWAYVVVNGKALYNSYAAVDFELHRSEEDTLVNRILQLAGIAMNKVGLADTASNLNQAEQQLQNQ